MSTIYIYSANVNHNNTTSDHYVKVKYSMNKVVYMLKGSFHSLRTKRMYSQYGKTGEDSYICI